MGLRLTRVRVVHDDDAPFALHDVDLVAPRGAFVCVLGPSGAGKSTLLRAIAGLVPLRAGTVSLDGSDVTDVPVEARNIALVEQGGALFPHLTARENVAFGLRARGVKKADREARADDMLARVHLSPSHRERLPRALSGGEQQRVALA